MCNVLILCTKEKNQQMSVSVVNFTYKKCITLLGKVVSDFYFQSIVYVMEIFKLQQQDTIVCTTNDDKIDVCFVCVYLRKENRRQGISFNFPLSLFLYYYYLLALNLFTTHPFSNHIKIAFSFSIAFVICTHNNFPLFFVDY